MFLLAHAELSSGWYPMPLCQASATTCGSRVLGDEYGMSLERCLLSVVDRVCRRESPSYKIMCVLYNDGNPLRSKVLALFAAKRKCAPECGTRQRIEYIIQISHDLVLVLRAAFY